MRDMQRWVFPLDAERKPAAEGDSRVKYVLASDAEAAVAAAERKGGPERIDAMLNRAYEEGFDSGQRDMLAKCIEVVGALYRMDDGDWNSPLAAVESDLSALEGQQAVRLTGGLLPGKEDFPPPPPLEVGQYRLEARP